MCYDINSIKIITDLLHLTSVHVRGRPSTIDLHSAHRIVEKHVHFSGSH